MRTVLFSRVGVGLVAAVVLAGAAGCGDDGVGGADDAARIVVTTSLLGDVVANLVGDDVAVEVLMPPNADPHDFAPSARQAAALRDADAVVVNGLGFEEGLLDTIEAAEDDGVPIIAATDFVEPLPFAGGDHDHEADADADGDHADDHDHAGDDHDHAEGEQGDADGHDHGSDEDAAVGERADDVAAEEDHAHADEATATDDGDDGHDHADDGHDHAAGDADPHLFTDPSRMAVAARGIGDALAERIDALATPEAQDRIDAYVATLEDLDAEVEDILDAVPPERRVLVTNHDVFGYFADRYDFEVLGSVIPGGGTLAEPSAADLADLADAIADAGVPAIFAEASAPRRLADALAAEGADVEVVELYTESLGGPDSEGATYVDMVRTNARRIAAALAPG